MRPSAHLTERASGRAATCVHTAQGSVRTTDLAHARTRSGSATDVRRDPTQEETHVRPIGCPRSRHSMGGSDLHLKHSSPPLIRVHGELQPIPSTSQLTPEETERVLEEMLVEPAKLHGVRRRGRGRLLLQASRRTARFRVNAFRQRRLDLARLPRDPLQIRSVEELALPPVVSELADEERGIVLVTGTTGSGKTTTLAAMIDHINSDARAPHRHDRGPDRVPAPRPAVGRSTSARWAPTPPRSPARCGACCARTRT